jgi:hypothetical protein
MLVERTKNAFSSLTNLQEDNAIERTLNLGNALKDSKTNHLIIFTK